LCITFVIAGHFDEIIITRSRLILFILQPKLREGKETFVMSESTKVTKKRKRESTIIHGRLQKFFQEEATSAFCLSFLNC